VRTAPHKPLAPKRAARPPADPVASLLRTVESPRVRAWLRALLTRGESAQSRAGARPAAQAPEQADRRQGGGAR
jgi:hypothetical protein